MERNVLLGIAIDWLKKLEWLETLPEEKIPLFNKIFERRHALRRHVNAPLLEERLKYLQYWSDNGATLSTLRFIAHYLLAIIDYLKLQKKKVITPQRNPKSCEQMVKKGDRKYLYEATRLFKNRNDAF